MTANTTPHPSHPRTWLITATTTPLGTSVARQILASGDCLVAGVEDVDMLYHTTRQSRTERGIEQEEEGDGQEEEERERVGEEGNGEGDGGDEGEGEEEEGRREHAEAFREFWAEVVGRREWRERCRGVGLCGRNVGQCQVAVAEAVAVFGKLDILLCCASQALIGTVEELGISARTRTLGREQFESNFFGPVNVIKAALPAMRRRNGGHIMVVTGTTGHLGTPGLGMYCAAGWALEGFCDSLAYEVAPFGIKMTIVQPTMEIGVLANKIVFAPSLPQYAQENNPAPLFRGIIGPLLDRIQGSRQDGYRSTTLATDEIVSLYPRLPAEMKASLLAETVHAIVAIGGHENPPARHIVGHEGVASVKEKLKTVSEELEDFIEVSCAVDINEDNEGAEDVNISAVDAD